VADRAGARGFERRDRRERGQLLFAETGPRPPELGNDRAGDERADALDLPQGGKARPAGTLELALQFAILGIKQLQLRDGGPNDLLALPGEDRAARCLVSQQRGDPGLGRERRDRRVVLRIAQQQQVMEPIDEPGLVLGQLGLGPAPELDCGGLIVLGQDPRQPGRLLAQQQRDRMGIQAIALALADRALPPRGGEPAGDLMDLLALGREVLGQAAAQEPGTLDRPGPLRPLPGPRDELGPGGRGVRQGPLALDPAFADRHCLVDPLVRVDADPDHARPLSGSDASRRRRSTRLTRVTEPAPIKSDRRRLHRAGDASRALQLRLERTRAYESARPAATP